MEMKLFWFLIPCIVVQISTFEIVDYMKDVAITNAHIKLASDMIILEDECVESGLEIIIKSIIQNNDYGLEMSSMNNMIAIPETPQIGDFEKSAKDQADLREKIQNKLDIPIPEVPESEYRTSTLIQLGNQRRIYTRQALINIFHQVVVASKEQFSSDWICRLIALFTTTKFPLSYIKYILTGPDTCITYDEFSFQTYRKIESEWYHVVGDINFMKLEEEFVY